MLDLIIDLVRRVCFFVDGIVYKFIGIIYNLLMEIANTSIFTEEIIDLFASKVYALLGIFMLFKVSFSIMTYIVNPDEFADKTKGFSKLISNIVITLALLLFTPWIFTQAMDVQRIVLKENIIGKIFSSNASSTFFSGSSNTGKEIAYRTFKAFYHINYEKFPSCEGIELMLDEEQDAKCLNELSITSGQYDDFKTLLVNAEILEDIDQNRSYALVTERKDADIWGHTYIMTYHAIISTIVGGFMAWILAMFCFDIALRSVKLGFLRMIAPIPIVSRVDPKSKGVFDKWTKMCVSTYLDLFIRLLAIFLALFIIEQVFNMDFVSQTTGLPVEVSLFTKIFIVIGALLFAKQLPKIIQDLTGAKFNGKFTLNPVKKFEEEAFGGKMITGAAAGLMTRGVPGMFSGGWAGLTQNKGFKEVKGQQISRRHALRDARADGSTWGARTAARFNQALGRDSRVDEIREEKNRITRDEASISDSINAINNAQAEQRVRMENNKAVIDAQNAEEKRALDRIKNGEAGSLSLEYNRRQTHLENLKSQMAAYQQQSTDLVNLTQSQRDAASAAATALEEMIAAQTQEDGRWLNNDAMYSYIDLRGAIDTGMSQDAALVNLIAATDELSRVHGVAMANDAAGRHGVMGGLRGANSTIQTSFYEQDAQKAEFNRQLEELKEQKRQLAEQERVAQANLNAINNSTK